MPTYYWRGILKNSYLLEGEALLMDTRIRWLLDSIACNHPLYYWCYEKDGHILESTCPTEQLLDAIFRHYDSVNLLFHASPDTPLILSNDSNILWLAVWESRNDLLHVLGPFFSLSADTRLRSAVSRVIDTNSTASARWKEQLMQVMSALPVISNILYIQYLLMLHHHVTGEYKQIGDIQYVACKEPAEEKEKESVHAGQTDDRTVNYLTERVMLNRIREGDASFGKLSTETVSQITIRSYTESPLLNFRISVTTLIALCTRAAIEGGLSPTQAYILGDRYIAAVFASSSISEIVNLRKQMIADFTQRVHKCRTNTQYSKPIKSCIDYIDTNLTETLSIDLLAQRLGYSPYYLSNRFKKETGVSVNNYIKFARLEQAKLQLETTNRRIEEIAESLKFSPRTIFDKAFKQNIGLTPAQYRTQHLQL